MRPHFGVLLDLNGRQMADTDAARVDPLGFENLELLQRARRTAFVRHVREYRQTGPKVSLADRAKHLAFFRLHRDRGANLPEGSQSLAASATNSWASSCSLISTMRGGYLEKPRSCTKPPHGLPPAELRSANVVFGHRFFLW